MKPVIAACAVLCIAGCNAPPGGPARPQASEAVDAAEEKSEPTALNRPVGKTATAVAASPTSNGPTLALDPEGLRWFLPSNGATRALAFGTSQSDVLASLERMRGEVAEGINADCGAGPVHYANWADGLSLVFKDDRFVGWGLDRRAKGAITTADGIGVGTSRSELDDAFGPPIEVRQSTLGTEFTAGNYHGLFDGIGANARISDMWAGVSCVAR